MRTIQTGGGADHITLVKLASHRIVNEFEGLKGIAVNYEGREFQFDIKIKETGYEGYTNANFEFRPDITVRHFHESEENRSSYEEVPWKSIFDSNFICFEAETDPKNIFNNALKMAAYTQIKGRENPIGRRSYAFVLVCWDDAKLPKSIEPFDTVWKFSKDVKP